MKKVGIVCCSNPMPVDYKIEMIDLQNSLIQLGIKSDLSDFIYQSERIIPNGVLRASDLMRLYNDREVDVIFDVFGGDIANEILPYLDYDLIAKSNKQFWGYSDLTVVLNAIYAKTGKCSVLYQIRNIINDTTGTQRNLFANYLCGDDSLFRFKYRFLQGTHMEGPVVGGNIRCFLKLAGTPYLPNLDGKILLLEAFGGDVPQMITYLSQLNQLEAYKRINGVILGTFTKMERIDSKPSIKELVTHFAGPDIPIIKTDEIGHGIDSRAIRIGQYYHFSEIN